MDDNDLANESTEDVSDKAPDKVDISQSAEKLVQNVKSVPQVPALAEPNTGTNTPAKDVPSNTPSGNIDVMADGDNGPKSVNENYDHSDVVNAILKS